MEHQLKVNPYIVKGASHNSTLRDFFETYAASSSDSAELADRLPDHLFRRSLTSQDEKFSVSRFVYSNPGADKLFDNRHLLLPPPQSDAQNVSKFLCDTMKGKHYTNEADNCGENGSSCQSKSIGESEPMSEAEKLYLYRKLLMQNKNEDHPSVIKHRRLMLDFQTRRDIVRVDNVVLPISVLHREGLDGVQGKIVYLKNPVNRLKSTIKTSDSVLTKRHQDEKRDNVRYRPKTAPIAFLSGSKPTQVTFKPLSQLNKYTNVNETRRVKSGVNFTTRYRCIMEGKQRAVTKPDSLELGIRNTMPLNARRASQGNAIRDDKNKEKGRDANEVSDSCRRSSEDSNSNSPIQTTPRLSLNVFIPREIEEVRMCNLPESYDTEAVAKTESDPIPDLTKNIIESVKTAGLISSKYGLSRTTKDLLSKCSDNSSRYPRFQYTQANLSSARTIMPASVVNAKKTVYPSNVAFPGKEHNKVFRNGFPKPIRSRETISTTLRLDGRRSTLT